MAFVVAKNRVTSLVREGKVDRMATLVISIANEFLDVSVQGVGPLIFLRFCVPRLNSEVWESVFKL